MSVGVTENGAILLGNHVACDAHDDTRAIRVVTHAHSDHIIELKKSLRKCRITLATPQTIDLLVELEKLRAEDVQKFRAVSYGFSLRFKGDDIRLFPANHILGSAQVLVTDERNKLRMLYTSDFKLSNTPVVECDILVMEATYGSPLHVRPFKEDVERIFIELVQEKLKSGPVYIFGFYGKLQEAIQILREADIDCPMIMPLKVFRIAKVYEKYGIELGHCIPSPSEESSKIVKSGEPYVGVYHTTSNKQVSEGATKITLSGWEFREPCKRIDAKNYLVALSDHSDFNQLIGYVEKCGPELVITDNYRGKNAEALATAITKKLGISAKSMP